MAAKKAELGEVSAVLPLFAALPAYQSHLIHLVKVQGRPQAPGVLFVPPLDASFAGIQVTRLRAASGKVAETSRSPG